MGILDILYGVWGWGWGQFRKVNVNAIWYKWDVFTIQELFRAIFQCFKVHIPYVPICGVKN